ncbi:hypothetical protein B0O99DRAFT_682272 [Bisporella sp. PMI_857]|nr:hypothetical protein B0O99DRAFT_682717 [Bisporella sp. PMI_857]KAH8600582.1 hypothetical protein B0O99DRAFT_682272 [Bisporella sp. PMI_857]
MTAVLDFVARFHGMVAQRDTSDELIKDLLIYCERIERELRDENDHLRKEIQDANLDLEDARRSRRELQQKLNIATQHMNFSKASMEKNPYIQVLIDGDGMVFNDNLIKLGVEGGKQAAAQLRNAVLEHCKASFNFIDVGHGKERADSKIKELTRWHLRNYNCKQILLGISHDAGYAPFLDEVIKPEERDIVTIMEGPKVVKELVATGIQIINFNDIFRLNKLTERVGNSSPAPSTWAGVTSIAPARSASPVITKNGVAVVNVKKGTPTLASAKPAWVPGPRGLDPTITVSPAVLEKIKHRTGNSKLCNNHYLRGPCAKGDSCCFEHKHKATEEDLKSHRLFDQTQTLAPVARNAIWSFVSMDIIARA